MSTQAVSGSASTAQTSSAIANANAVGVSFFGVLMNSAVGFIPTSEVHNAAHDIRHSA